MAEIERRWFGDQSTCADDNSPFSSRSLDFVNFWGLFLITGIASTICLIICVASFLYKNRGFLNNVAAEESSIKRRVQSVVRLYDEKDPRSRTFRSDGKLRQRTMEGSRDASVSPSLNNINLESPISTSHHHPFEDGRTSVELPSPMAETPPHANIERPNVQ